MKIKKIHDSPTHYEVEGNINFNQLMKEIENIPEENCHIEINGNSYHFPNKISREYFVLGIDLAFQLLR